MIRFSYFLLLALGCYACGGNAPEAPAATDEATTPQTEATNRSLTDLLQPNVDSLPYPVYASFDELASLFTQADDKTYVINFWATWCKPCVEEMPYFERLAAESGPDTEVVAVSLDFKKDIGTKLKRFVANNPDLPPVVALSDAKYDNWIDRVDPSWGGAIPVTVIYRNDERRFHASRYDSYEELTQMVAEFR